LNASDRSATLSDEVIEMPTRFVFTWLWTLLAGVALTGCPKAELSDGDTADDVPVAAPAAAPEAEAVDPPQAEPAAPAMRKAAVVTGVTVTRVEVAKAEDGHGLVVEAVDPVAIEIAAEAWPVRALDPVLRIGDLEFRSYTFPRVNVLRYVAADAASLPTDAEVTVQYGDDAASRVVVAERLEAPR
jgi:hypothetical protein